MSLLLLGDSLKSLQKISCRALRANIVKFFQHPNLSSLKVLRPPYARRPIWLSTLGTSIRCDFLVPLHEPLRMLSLARMSAKCAAPLQYTYGRAVTLKVFWEGTMGNTLLRVSTSLASSRPLVYSTPTSMLSMTSISLAAFGPPRHRVRTRSTLGLAKCTLNTINSVWRPRFQEVHLTLAFRHTILRSLATNSSRPDE